MTAELKELISKLGKVTPKEYGKMWKAYSSIYKKSDLQRIDEWIKSDTSMPDLDDKEGILDFFSN